MQLIPIESINELTFREIFNKSFDLSIDYSEITLDSLFDDAVVREIPIVKTVVAAVKIGIAYREKYFLKKLLVFLSEINKGDINTENIIAFREKMQRDKKYRDKVITMISVLLDKFVDDKKSKNIREII